MRRASRQCAKRLEVVLLGTGQRCLGLFGHHASGGETPNELKLRFRQVGSPCAGNEVARFARAEIIGDLRLRRSIVIRPSRSAPWERDQLRVRVPYDREKSKDYVFTAYGKR
jgi:hypothetical protein